MGAAEDTSLFYATDGFGSAVVHLRDLLAILDELAPAAGHGPGRRRAMKTPPHSYIPDGPIETAPYLAYERPEIRHAAFAAVLEGVELGAYDTRMVTWLAEVGDDPTCRTIASLMWRYRLAGGTEAR